MQLISYAAIAAYTAIVLVVENWNPRPAAGQTNLNELFRLGTEILRQGPGFQPYSPGTAPGHAQPYPPGNYTANPPPSLAPPPPHAAPPVPTSDRARYPEIVETQALLNQLGYRVGPSDGQLGPKTQSAIEAFQREAGLSVTGEPSNLVLQRLRSAAGGRAFSDAGLPRPSASVSDSPANSESLPPPGSSAAFTMLNGYDLPGGDYRSGIDDPRLSGIATDECRQQCALDSRCLAFTYNVKQRVCLLKGAVPKGVPYAGAVSGLKTAGTTQGHAPRQIAGAPRSMGIGAMVAPAPAGAPVAPAPAGAAGSDQSIASGSPGASPLGDGTPADTAAVARRFGLRTLRGRLVLSSDYNPVGNRVLQHQDIVALRRFFELLRLRLNPEVGKREDVALCLANTFLGPDQKNQILSNDIDSRSWGKRVSFRRWKGARQNEFEAARSRQYFIDNYLQDIIADAPRLPMEFVYINGATLLEYNRQRSGFPIEGMPQSELTLPPWNCLAGARTARPDNLFVTTEFPTFWQVDPQTAEQTIVKRLPVDRSADPFGRGASRRVYSATTLTLSAAPAAKGNPKYARNDLVPLAARVKSVALYEDPDLERPIHTFAIETMPSAVMTTGRVASIPARESVRLTAETAMLLFLKDHHELGPEGWRRLLHMQYEADQQYFSRIESRKLANRRRNLGRDDQTITERRADDANYIPFFPTGFASPLSGPLSDAQLHLFKQWSIQRAEALPRRLVVYGSLSADDRSKLLSLSIGDSFENATPPKSINELLRKGYVPGQIVRPKLSGSDRAISTSGADGHTVFYTPMLVLANQLKAYQLDVKSDETRPIPGSDKYVRLAGLDAAIDVIVERTERLPAEQGSGAFAIYVRPERIRAFVYDPHSVILEQKYDVAALNPSDITAATQSPRPPEQNPPSQKAMPFSAEFIDLLIAKFHPELLTAPVLERMMLTRWYYEREFNGRRKEPEWGRFFVAGKPKPDAAQRTQLLDRFKSWTVQRAAAMPTRSTVVFPNFRPQTPGPVKLGEGLFPSSSVGSGLKWAADGCRTSLGGPNMEKAGLTATVRNGCEYLKSAAELADRDVYIGSSAMYLLKKRRPPQSQGVGPRWHCNRAMLGQDAYCYVMQNTVLKDDLPGRPAELDDVLLIDKNIVVPSDRPDLISRRVSNGAIELDVEIVGVHQSDKIPESAQRMAYGRYSRFLQKIGVDKDSPAELGDLARATGGMQELAGETVPFLLIDAHALAARYVDAAGNNRTVIADLPLREPQPPNDSKLRMVEPERPAAPKAVSSPDIVGLRLGMSFEQADKIVRAHMNVGRYLVADRAWQAKAATGQIEPYTSGRLYQATDDRETIIFYDEPPAAPGVVLGVVRQVVLPKGTIAPAALYAEMEKKYGKAQSEPHSAALLWYSAGRDRACRPDGRSGFQSTIWRDPERGPSERSAQVVRYFGRYELGLSLVQMDYESNVAYRKSTALCGVGVRAAFDPGRKAGDILVIQLFNESAYAQTYKKSQKMLENGKSAAQSLTPKTKIDLKF